MPATPQDATKLPAGDVRRDTLKANADALAQQAEEQDATVGAVDPAAIEIDRELAFEIVEHNALEVSNKRPGYRYCWVRAYEKSGAYTMAPVMEKEAIRVRLRGESGSVPAWEVVVGKDSTAPEAREHMSVEGYRKLGDCILMRCKEEVYQALEAREKRIADEFAGKFRANVDDFIKSHGMEGILSANETGGLSARQYAQVRREFARNGDLAKFNQMAREGRLPNLTPAAAAAGR